jgi:hypothetical protein
MDKDKNDLISQYRNKVISANKELTKKSVFKDLLNRCMQMIKTILQIIDKISLGAESSVLISLAG